MKKIAKGLVAGALLLAAIWLVPEPAVAQVTTPVPSPYATVSEQVGITNITIKYCRPGVNGRQIWGTQVPYGFTQPFPNFGSGNAYPWRAGANENTTISFQHDVMIEGKTLAAGTYGLHMIPTENEWTVIFSNNSTSWGSFFYNEAEDALRVTVQPVEAPHRERLMYQFKDHEGADKVTVALQWEELEVPFEVQIDDVHEVVLASMRKELRSRGGFGWQGYSQAATYAAQNNVNHEEALQWAERAVNGNKSFNTLRVKSSLMAQTGAIAEADQVMEEAFEISTENQLNAYGYQLVGQNRLDKALEIFKLNVERHPDAWNPRDSLGECYATMGEIEKARENYETALKMLPANDHTNRDRINGILENLASRGSH